VRDEKENQRTLLDLCFAHLRKSMLRCHTIFLASFAPG
jgi:hypothetical protein